MKRIVFFSSHTYPTKRKAGFNFLAESFHQRGWEVVFVTSHFSYLSYINKDRRLKNIRKPGIREVIPHFYHSTHFTLFHPVKTPSLIKRLVHPLFKLYAYLPFKNLEEIVSPASFIVFESCSCILLFDRVKRFAPKAKTIYRVSDDLAFLKAPYVTLRKEKELVNKFDLISTPTQSMFETFKEGRTRLELHGINKKIFDECKHTPYTKPGPHAIFVGNSFLDTSFFSIATRLFPSWTFHLIGPFQNVPTAPNLIQYGELPFSETIPYVKFADVGLQTRSYSPGVESLSNSLKVIQYSYCNLPIVCPHYISLKREHAYYYDNSDEASIKKALEQALLFKQSKKLTKKDEILSWDEITENWEQALYSEEKNKMKEFV